MPLSRLISILFIAAAFTSGCQKITDPVRVEDPRVVILMYHRITAGEPENLYERSVTEMEKDLIYMRDKGIRVIDFDELEEVVSGEKQLTTHAAIITFDDGDHSWFTLAAPLLKQYRMKATFFLWVSRIGSDSFLSWDEVSLMSNYTLQGGVHPFIFGSHTMSHQFLTEMREALGYGEAFHEYLDEELGGSKRSIERYTYGKVEALALPYGDGAGESDIIEAAQRHGYRFIRTSERNITGAVGANLFRLPSLPLLDDTDQLLIGGYLGIE